MVDEKETWWQDKEQKGRALIDDIRTLATRARAAGFPITEYILNLAADETAKVVEQENKSN